MKTYNAAPSVTNPGTVVLGVNSKRRWAILQHNGTGSMDNGSKIYICFDQAAVTYAGVKLGYMDSVVISDFTGFIYAYADAGATNLDITEYSDE